MPGPIAVLAPCCPILPFIRGEGLTRGNTSTSMGHKYLWGAWPRTPLLPVMSHNSINLSNIFNLSRYVYGRTHTCETKLLHINENVLRKEGSLGGVAKDPSSPRYVANFINLSNIFNFSRYVYGPVKRNYRI